MLFHSVNVTTYDINWRTNKNILKISLSADRTTKNALQKYTNSHAMKLSIFTLNKQAGYEESKVTYIAIKLTTHITEQILNKD